MNKKISAFVWIAMVLSVFLAACGSNARPTEPDEIYWAYWEACSDQNLSEARTHLTEGAKQRAQTLGVCGFTHDAINTYEKNQGNPVRTFSEDPELYVEEEIASLTWIDDSGNLAMVVMVPENGEWKIQYSRWSK
ncbi:MAG: hypothetical protein R6U57_08260 [Anaerolineales bacterium]